MKETATQLETLIYQVYPHLSTLSDEETSLKTAPGKWSKKEVLGHLIDSAANNQQKFVRAQQTDSLVFQGYDQDFWVSIQQYQHCSWQHLVELWKYYNLHLSHIILHFKAGTLNHQISISNSQPATLEFIASDYIRHTMHHLKQIFPDMSFYSQ